MIGLGYGMGHFKPQGALSQHRGANSLLRWVLLRSRCQFSLLDHQIPHPAPRGPPGGVGLFPEGGLWW
jgi:hypothetical protein